MHGGLQLEINISDNGEKERKTQALKKENKIGNRQEVELCKPKNDENTKKGGVAMW